jgi:hypothetical protein
VTLCVFPLLVALLLVATVSRPLAALSLVAGVLAGAALGWYGLRLTKFEQTDVGLFYTPSAHLGIALSLLLIARIGYRAAYLYFVPEAITEGVFARSPLTLLIFGTLAGYYIAYAIGLIRWRRRVRLASPAAAQDRQDG